MRRRLAHAVCRLEALERQQERPTRLQRLDGRAKLLVTAGYTALLLAIPLTHLSEVLLFALYPIVTARAAAIPYRRIVRQSLVVVPFVAGIALFNLFEQPEPLFRVGGVCVSVGWVTCCSILLRGLLSLQALLLLIHTTGFRQLCQTLRRCGVPEVLATQLHFVYRYLGLLLQEGITLSLAREARSCGRRSYPLRTWGPLVGQLLLRTFDRAGRIGDAMAARGFTGCMPELPGSRTRWQRAETLYVAGWGVLLLGLRFLSPERIF